MLVWCGVVVCMSWFIIVLNCVVLILEGELVVGGFVIGVYDVLKEIGGMWFGWSGEVVVFGVL